MPLNDRRSPVSKLGQISACLEPIGSSGPGLDGLAWPLKHAGCVGQEHAKQAGGQNHLQHQADCRPFHAIFRNKHLATLEVAGSSQLRARLLFDPLMILTRAPTE